MTRTLAALLAFALSTPAHADAAKLFKPGDLITPTRDYNHETDTFTNTPPPGEGGACFRVDRVTPDQIDITLIAGPYHPWWSDVPFAPGHTDSLVRADGYAEHHPAAPPLALAALIYTIVPACPGTS